MILHTYLCHQLIREASDSPLQCSCVEKPRDGGACWAAVYGVAQSRTRLRRLSSSSSWLPRGNKKESEVSQSCLTLCDPMDCSLPGSPVPGILQARILGWAAIAFSRRSSQPRDWTRVSCIVGRCFTTQATKETRERLKCSKWYIKNFFWG